MGRMSSVVLLTRSRRETRRRVGREEQICCLDHDLACRDGVCRAETSRYSPVVLIHLRQARCTCGKPRRKASSKHRTFFSSLDVPSYVNPAAVVSIRAEVSFGVRGPGACTVMDDGLLPFELMAAHEPIQEQADRWARDLSTSRWMVQDVGAVGRMRTSGSSTINEEERSTFLMRTRWCWCRG